MFKVGQFFNYRSKQNFILHSYLPIYSLFGDTLWANNNLVRLCRIVTFQKEDVKNVAKIKYRESTFNTFKELNSLRIRELNEPEFFFLLSLNLIIISFLKLKQIFTYLISKYIVMIHGMQTTVIYHVNHRDLDNTHWLTMVQKYTTKLR